MSKQISLNPEAGKKETSKHSFFVLDLILYIGPIALGFLVTWRYGGFPSILLPSFIILAFGLLSLLFATLCNCSFTNKTEPMRPLRAIFYVIAFYLLLTWMLSAGLPLLSSPKLNRLLRKVEFPFSEASHVVADSDGSIYVYSQFNLRIQKYNKYGSFLFGWYASNWKNAEVAIDEKNFIYVYSDYIVRKFDNNGKLVDDILNKSREKGWWRFTTKSIIWDQNVQEPKQYDPYGKETYNTAIKINDLLPTRKSSKSGFKNAEGYSYRITKLWHLFPIVSVTSYHSKTVVNIMPNPLSLTFTFVFPGFLFYAIALFFFWALEKSTARLPRQFLYNAVIIVIILIFAFIMLSTGAMIVTTIANSLPKNNPMHFWLIPLTIIPYWIIVIFFTYRLIRKINYQKNSTTSTDKDCNS